MGSEEQSSAHTAIVDLKRRAAQKCREKHGMTILPEESPHGDSQSNGLVEGAVRDLKAVDRSLRFAASELHQCEIGAKHPLLPWLVSYSGAVINRSQRGSDGLTPFRRWKGRDFRRPLPPFSEVVSFLPAGKNPSRVQDKWHEGIFLGVLDRSSELLVATPAGVVRTRSVRRRAPDERGSKKLLDGVRGTPWQPVPGAVADCDGSFPTVIYAQPVTQPGAPVPVLPPTARQVYLRRNVELRKFGYTVGCSGCDAARAGSAQRGHTDVCRQRSEAVTIADGYASTREACRSQTRPG